MPVTTHTLAIAIAQLSDGLKKQVPSSTLRRGVSTTVPTQALGRRAGRHLVASQEAPEPVGCQALGVVAVAGPAPQHRALHGCLQPGLCPSIA